jgi:predicted dehydrogenase
LGKERSRLARGGGRSGDRHYRITTPNDSHGAFAIAAAATAAGKAILCEKPLALDANEAKRMAVAVRKARVSNMV